METVYFFQNFLFSLASWLIFWGKKVSPGVISPDGKLKIKYRPRTADEFIIWEIFNIEEYANKKYPLKRSDVVVDIGAQIGVFTTWVAIKARDGKVISYEPDPENFSYLRINVRNNRLKNVALHNQAVSGSSKDVVMIRSAENSGGGSLFGRGILSGKSFKVKSVTLKDIFSQNRISRIDLLKIDAEGAEYEIILKSSDRYLKKIRRLILEYHDYFKHGHKYPELVNKLQLAGFQVQVRHYFPGQKVFFKCGVIEAKGHI